MQVLEKVLVISQFNIQILNRGLLQISIYDFYINFYIYSIYMTSIYICIERFNYAILTYTNSWRYSAETKHKCYTVNFITDTDSKLQLRIKLRYLV